MLLRMVPASVLGARLDSLAKQIDFTHNLHGLGLYVSPEMEEMVQFPFPVTKKTSVGTTFALRDLESLKAFMNDYLLLAMTLDGAKLYRGNGTRLEEIVNDDFPRKHLDDYEYERPFMASSYGWSLKSVEGDKSAVNEERYMRFLKDMDKALSPYLSENFPLIVTGVKEELGFFQKVTTHKASIAGKILGSYNHHSLQAIGEMAFEQLTKSREMNTLEEIKKMEEAIGQELAVTGIREVWKEARAGKGMLLLVEKDFVKQGFVKPGSEYLYLTPPVEIHQVLDDAVEAIIQTVIEKNGKVIFTDNGLLEDQDHIALVLRYR